MPKTIRFKVLVLILSFLFCAGIVVAQNSADTIIVNARVYTVNPKQAWAEAVAVRGGKIIAVGTEKDVKKFSSKSTHVIDAQGKLLLPGFEDCHIHFMSGSLGLSRIDIQGVKTIAEVQKIVKDYAAAHPNEPWIIGRGWTYPLFGEVALPDKKFLDEVVSDRPVHLEGFDGHSGWANSKALEAAGITRDTPNPPNGEIVRDNDGNATGALKESADDLVTNVIPQPTKEERLAALKQGIQAANKAGLVRVHSAGQDFEWFDLFDQLRRENTLTLRFYIAYFLDPGTLTPKVLDNIEQARKKYNDDWLAGGAVKTMLDGVVESHTAAMLSPYSDDPTRTGKLFWDVDEYKHDIQELEHRGFQIFTHAIGDRAVRTALDAYENSAKENHLKDSRPRIEHIETISPPDIARFGKLGVIASFQPLHAYPDEDTLQIWARNAGPDRAKRAWVWNSIQKANGKLAFGSDWPVVTLNPWSGMQNAVTRQTLEGDPPGGFLPGERISVEDAIKAYTLGAAFAARREKTEGSLEVGKLADLIIVSQDLFKIEPSEISNTEVMLTMVGGKVVYQSPKWVDTGAAKEGQ